ncbi:MAG: DNA gyrase/topoisomerase IV subunit A [Bacteroidetes bacterium]|nr:DNA gyrase/topoisomerase IV subunit A [Bacteroidota bacterium]HET6245153.1 DNA gyrase/topoisomerase IV subunit A [Bacteroidia bacterium]
MIENEENEIEPVDNTQGEEDKDMHNVVHVAGMYKDWFLDYASYVILERAVPALEDGLKPVHRRILHSLNELEDGRYNKVANVIGNTMKFHPHGDASIADAMVQIGQKDILIDTQGNWGNILTGDSAAAPRYIEARLSKFALEVVFNPKTTLWQSSYDGRNKEPVTLPVKFPLLLAQGVEGIAVGLACKILPHNFNELIDGSIDVLRGKKVYLVPDFPTGGMMDASSYNDGLRGGKIRVRAKISALDKKTLVITEIPFGTTTSTLIDSILTANDKGKIKIRKVEDNTAEFVEIIIHLQAGISPDKTIDALYAFTSCESSISPNAGVIFEDKPRFIGVEGMLKEATRRTVDLLKQELMIRMSELESGWHFSSLEKIFIEKRIYRKIEECETWEAVIQAIDTGLKPFKKLFKREITRDDILRLTEIKIKRISKFDSFKADDHIKGIEDEMLEVQKNLDTIVDYAIEYYKNLKKKYGKGRERKTEIKSFDTIVASQVAADNVKLYVNREDGFAGFGLRRDEFVCDCSDLDDVIVFRADGSLVVTKIADKAFVGKDIIHIDIFKKNDTRTVYNLIYQDGPKGAILMKRFAVTGVTRDKVYDLTKGTKASSVLYFTANPNGEAEVLTVHLKPKPKLKKLFFDIDLGELAIKGRASQGNTVTKFPIKKIVQKQQGVSSLGARKIWFDDTVQRLNDEGRGTYLGSFGADDKILTITSLGEYKLNSFDLSTRFDDEMVLIEKFYAQKVLTAIYLEGEKKEFYVKRFNIESLDKKILFISETPGSNLELITTVSIPQIEIRYAKSKDKELNNEQINLNDFIGVKGEKAKGKRLTINKVKEINLIVSEEQETEPESESEPEPEMDTQPKDSDKQKPVKGVSGTDISKIELPSMNKKKNNEDKKDSSQIQLGLDL